MNVSVCVSPQICSCAHWTLIDEVAWGGVSSCICGCGFKTVELVGKIFCHPFDFEVLYTPYVYCCLSTIVAQEKNISTPVIWSWGGQGEFQKVASLKAQCRILLCLSRWEAGVKQQDHVSYAFPCLTDSGWGQFISLLFHFDGFYYLLLVEPTFFLDSSSHESVPLWDCRWEL